jgi:hypothetical protein
VLIRQYINTSTDTSTHQGIKVSTYIIKNQHTNTSTHQHINTSTHQHTNTSAHQHINTSTHQHMHTSTLALVKSVKFAMNKFQKYRHESVSSDEFAVKTLTNFAHTPPTQMHTFEFACSHPLHPTPSRRLWEGVKNGFSWADSETLGVDEWVRWARQVTIYHRKKQFPKFCCQLNSVLYSVSLNHTKPFCLFSCVWLFFHYRFDL